MTKRSNKKTTAAKKPQRQPAVAAAPQSTLNAIAQLTSENGALRGTLAKMANEDTKKKTCFIVMPIGDQKFSEGNVTAAELKRRYTDLIREALEKSRSNLEIVRADDVTSGGGITNDIFTRIMNSDYVVADLSYPNPNVYYELGIRHACRPGTITIRDKSSPYRAPFDISNLRHIEYDNTPTGLKTLASDFERRFNWLDNNPGVPDNQFLELAQFVEYQFQHYGKRKEESLESAIDSMVTLMQYPELVETLSSGKLTTPADFIGLFSRYPDAAKAIIRMMLKSGTIKLPAGFGG